jgi:hypothetical protein
MNFVGDHKSELQRSSTISTNSPPNSTLEDLALLLVNVKCLLLQQVKLKVLKSAINRNIT